MATNLVDLSPYLDPALATAPSELTDQIAAGTHPLVLLPVRLETRFFPTAQGTTELRVRVYPDKVHLDSHDPALSAEEQAAGRAYWERRWRAGDDDERLRRAWGELSDRFGPGRAAWVARSLQPTNPDDRPAAGVPEDAPLPAAPRFNPGPATAVVRTPVARALPKRWVATAYDDGAVLAVAVGRDLPSSLAVGPDLDPALALDATDDAPAIDDGMRWMVDFDAAEAVGMALRVALPQSVESARVDVLLVSGVADAGPDEGAAACAALVDAHHFADGFGMLAPGVQSNNTDAEPSGWSDRDRGGARSYAAEWSGTTVARDDGSAAGALAGALGLPTEAAQQTLGTLPGAARDDLVVARAMTTAMWPATWGYYLTQHVGLDGAEVGPRLSLQDVAWAANHARDFLRPGGPLPAVRCGRQPYGVLPVTSLNRWSDDTADGARLTRLRDALAGLRDGIWRPASGSAARVGATDDPSSDLVDVLRSYAQPTSLRVRRLMGPHFLRHLRLFLGEDLDGMGFWQRLQTLSDDAVTSAGLGFLPALSRAVYEGATSEVVAPLVAGPDGTGASPRDYLTELLGTTDLDALATPVPEESVPVLQALMRHALLREHALLGARLLEDGTLTTAQLIRDAELVDLVRGEPPTPGWRWQRDQVLPGDTRSVREALTDLASLPQDDTAALREWRAAVQELAERDVPTLEQHLLGSLAATSHRLDAWVTSLASRRLRQLREERPDGVQLGGYGWLEDLRPEAHTEVAEPPQDEPGPVLLPDSDAGFVHAPSLDQAATAALLRNAHLAHGGGRDGAYAIQLTSSRVRGALRLLDGVRQGQSLGALLGYDVERALHETHPADDPEATLDDLLDDVRSLAPPADVDAVAAKERRVLLDGMVLLRRWRDEGDALVTGLPRCPVGSGRFRAVRGILQALDRSLDGVADAVTAEGVYQLVRGNLARASATLEDVTRGEANPPDLEHQRTKRSGLSATHRVALLLDANATLPESAGWAPVESSIRASADPALNTWLGLLLGPAERVRLRLEVTSPDGPPQGPDPVRLSDLGLTPMDLMRLSMDASGRAELAARAYRAAVPTQDRPPRVRVALAAPASGVRDEVTIEDLLEVASSAYASVSKARPADGADLAPPHEDAATGIDLDEYEARATAALTSLRQGTDDLTALLAADAAEDRLADAVRAAAELGTPVGAPGDQTLVAALAPSVRADLARRVAEADVAAQVPAGETNAQRRARVVRMFSAVFGPGFVPAPRFACPDPGGLRDSLRDRAALTDGDPLAGQTWWLRMARLRPRLAQLDLMLREAEAIGGRAEPALQLAQLPHAAGQRWVALPPASGTSLRDGVVSLGLNGTGIGRLSEPVTGYLVDEWTDVIPNPSETTGIAFRYDPPDAAPPQSILVAVPPVRDEPWTVGTLHQVLLETLDLAHLRSCAPDDLEAAGHYLPATVLAFNLDGEAVSTDLNPLTS